MLKTAIGDLKVPNVSELNKLVGLSDLSFTSNRLQLKLTEKNIENLIECGVLGIPTDGYSVQGKNHFKDNLVVSSSRKKKCTKRKKNFNACDNVIGELEVSDSSIFNKLANLNGFRATSKELRLKLTEENIGALIDSGAIGIPLDVASPENKKPLNDIPVIAQPTEGSCSKIEVQETVIGELELSDLAVIDEYLNLSDSSATSKGLGLKLTENSIKILIESGAIGIPSNSVSVPFKNTSESMNGLLPDDNNSTVSGNVKRKGKSRNSKMICDKPSTAVVEKKHQTRKRREIISPSRDTAEHLPEESTKNEKQHARNNIALDVQKPPPVKRATRNMGVGHRKHLAASRSREDENDKKQSLKKVSVNTELLEISPVAKSRTVNVTSPTSESNNEENTTDASKIVTDDELNCNTDDLKTTSESEPTDTSHRCKLPNKHKVSFKTNSPNGHSPVDFKTTSESEPTHNSHRRKPSNKHKVSFRTNSPNGHSPVVQEKITKIRNVTLSSSEEDYTLQPTESLRTENILSESTSNDIQTVLQKYNLKPDVLSQKMDINSFNSFWQRAGHDSHLVVLRKQVLDGNEPCYSLAIVQD